MAHERKTYQAEFSRKIIKFAKIKPTMKLFSQRMIGIGVLSLSLAASLKVAAHDWPEATLESRPGSRWWWLGSAVDSANLAKNISEYAKAGIATLEVTPIYGVKGNEANDIPYLSPKWMKMLDIACRKGAKHGIRIELNNGTGWPFGGPDVTKEDAAKKAVFRRVAKPEGAGDTIILEIANTMQKVKRAAPGGEGLVVDHLDKGAVGMYLSKFDSAFSKAGMAFPEVLFSDSYEDEDARHSMSKRGETRNKNRIEQWDGLAFRRTGRDKGRRGQESSFQTSCKTRRGGRHHNPGNCQYDAEGEASCPRRRGTGGGSS